MAIRSVALTTIKGGINRLRTKGAALNDSLYDLKNAYVTAQKTVVGRPGTFRTVLLTAGTKGLCSFDGSLHVFAAVSVAVPTGVTLHILSHPTSTAVAPIAIQEIHFAAPFMGFLYVVAEFVGGDVYHFWIQTGAVWKANTAYKLGDIVAPSVPNGLSFQATRITAANVSWAPGVQRAVANVIEPTVYNDFFYTVTSVLGANPRSGETEPVWPTESGAQINEDADGSTATPATPTPQPDVTVEPAPTVVTRYGAHGFQRG